MNTLRLQLHLRPSNLTNPTKSHPQISQNKPKSLSTPNIFNSKTRKATIFLLKPLKLELKSLKSKILLSNDKISNEISNGHSRIVILGAMSLGLVLFLMGFDDHKAIALGPEGPLMEEFWENMRRYALYALTVSSGALYILVEPILELLKNPISAVLILTIIGGGIFIVSQVVTAMVGLSDFSYDYNY